MSRVSELIVKIRGDVSGALKGIREVSGEVGKLSRETRSAFGGFNQAFEQMSGFGSRLTVGLTLPMAAVGAAAIKADADLDALERGLVAVSGSSVQAQAQLKRLEEVAKLPGLGFREAVQGSINLQAAGLSAQTAERALFAFGNALATVGKGKADLDGVILALGQIESKGKISAEEINQLAERVPQIRQAMKAAFGTADTEQLQKMGLSATEFINRVVAEFEKLPKTSGGVKNAFENIQDAIQRSLAEIGKSMRPATEAFLGAAEPLIKKVADLAKGFRDLDPATQVAIGGLITVVGATPPVLTAVGQLGLGITGLVTGLKLLGAMGLGSILAGLKAGLVGIGATAASLGAPVLIAAAAVAALGVAARHAGQWKEFKDNTDYMAGAMKRLQASMSPVPPTAEQLAAGFKRLEENTGAASKETETYSASLKELGGAMQGPKTLMEEISEVIGRRQQNETAKMIEEAADAMERGGINGSLLQLRYAEVGDQAVQLTFSQQLLKKAWDELNATTGASDAQLRSYLFTMRAITGDENLQRMQKLAEAYKTIGYNAEETNRLQKLQVAYRDIVSGGGDRDAREKARIAILQERRRLGEKLTKEELEDLAKAERANQSAATKTQNVWTEAASRVKTGFSALSTDLTNLLIKGGKFGDVMVDALSKIGQSLLSLGIEKALGKVLDYTGKIIKQIPGIGGALGKLGGIFGGGGSGGGSNSVPSIPSGGAGSIGGLAGTFSAIGSIGSMVSGIIGNFQMGSMNSKLKAMESQLRGLLGQTIHNTERYNEFLPALPAIHQRLMEIRQIGVRVFTTDSPLEVMVAGGGLGGGGITINMEGSNFIGFRDLDAFLDELARRLRQRM